MKKASIKISLHHLNYLLLLGVLILILASACSSNIDHNTKSLKQPLENCRVVQHLMGETCIPLNPERVVTLNTRILSNVLALGIKPVGSIGLSTNAYADPFPTYLQGKIDRVEFVGTGGEPNLEKILLIKPDLIVADSSAEKIYSQLSNIAPTLILEIASPPRSWKQELIDIATVLNKKEVANQLIDEYWQRIEKLRQALSERHQLQLQISVANTQQSFMFVAYGKIGLPGTIIDDIKLQRPPSQNINSYYLVNISEERLLDIDGDVLFLTLFTGSEGCNRCLFEQLQQKPLWQKLSVVQRNRVYLVDGSKWHADNILAAHAIIDDLFKYLIYTP